MLCVGIENCCISSTTRVTITVLVFANACGTNSNCDPATSLSFELQCLTVNCQFHLHSDLNPRHWVKRQTLYQSDIVEVKAYQQNALLMDCYDYVYSLFEIFVNLRATLVTVCGSSVLCVEFGQGFSYELQF